MNACNAASLTQLLLATGGFLLAVLWLDIYWVRTSPSLRDEDAGTVKRQSWLNAFIALGAMGAAFLLVTWTASCANAAL
jgi:hypothetical protein